MARVRFGKEQLRVRPDLDARGARQDRRVFADEILVHARVGAAAALALLKGKRGFRQPVKLRGI